MTNKNNKQLIAPAGYASYANISNRLICTQGIY